MDLSNIGHRCALRDCNKLDFLPFTCGACERIYCLDHRTYSGHSCSDAKKFNVQVFVCPLCKGGVRVEAAGPDAAFAYHESSGECARSRAINARTPTCGAPKCKKRLGQGLQATCRECGKNFCSEY